MVEQSAPQLGTCHSPFCVFAGARVIRVIRAILGHAGPCWAMLGGAHAGSRSHFVELPGTWASTVGHQRLTDMNSQCARNAFVSNRKHGICLDMKASGANFRAASLSTGARRGNVERWKGDGKETDKTDKVLFHGLEFRGMLALWALEGTGIQQQAPISSQLCS